VLQKHQKPGQVVNDSRRFLAKRRKGSIFVEYLLLLTIVGLGGLVGIAEVRAALHNELIQLAAAINAITPGP